MADMHHAVGVIDRARELQELSSRQLGTATAEPAGRERSAPRPPPAGRGSRPSGSPGCLVARVSTTAVTTVERAVFQ
jgi:hypothetical protein